MRLVRGLESGARVDLTKESATRLLDSARRKNIAVLIFVMHMIAHWI